MFNWSFRLYQKLYVHCPSCVRHTSSTSNVYDFDLTNRNYGWLFWKYSKRFSQVSAQVTPGNDYREKYVDTYPSHVARVNNKPMIRVLGFVTLSFRSGWEFFLSLFPSWNRFRFSTPQANLTQTRNQRLSVEKELNRCYVLHSYTYRPHCRRDWIRSGRKRSTWRRPLWLARPILPSLDWDFINSIMQMLVGWLGLALLQRKRYTIGTVQWQRYQIWRETVPIVGV